MTRSNRRLNIPCLLLALFWCQCRPAKAQDTTRGDPAAVEFFEREVRPVFVGHCQSCHGPKKQEMGLRLDSAKGLSSGSDNGPVVVSGMPDQSSLIEAVRYRGDTKMPPKGRLSDRQISALAKWVEQGAIWPQDDTSAVIGKTGASAGDSSNHWAFQPIRSPTVPKVKARDRVVKPIDAFILATLEASDLSLSPPADRRTLIRRVTFDLHGLPPTPEEVAAFESDRSPDAFRKVVERLLSSPRYGERWGRHWLDVARYSDTKGYVRLNENSRYPGSWTYRDYVIASMNNDLPFDQFILQQLAADQLLDGGDRRSLAALGFLTLGQRFLNSAPDVIDDRIDVVSRGLLGMTVSCARCHDHKFDPIPTRDYYSLYGVFANSVEPTIPPLILPANEQLQHEEYLKELTSRSNQFEQYLQEQLSTLTTSMRARAGEYLLAGEYEPVQANFLAVMFLVDASKDLNPVMVQRWARHLEQSRKRHDPVLSPWHELARLAKPRKNQPISDRSDAANDGSQEFASLAGALIAKWQTAAVDAPRLNRVVIEALTASPPANLEATSQIYGRILQEVEQHWHRTQQENSAATQLADPNWEEVRQLLMGTDSPLTVKIGDVEEFLFADATAQQQLHAKQRLVTDWISSPNAAPHAMALEDAQSPHDARVFIRGNASNPGETVPRQFLAALSRGERRPFQHGSGRLELARKIASADNPLTARVIVNRVWMHHFGAGLVRTPSDFGLRGERPTHPELLDHLASQFVASGWSLKQLHREIMLSSAYQQQSASGDSPAFTAARLADPENELLWSMPRRRLDWESLRDSMVSVSGQADWTMGGPSVDLFTSPYSARRSVYGLIDRQKLASELRTFDFAPPDASSPQRHQTTVPQQALFLMNSPFLKHVVGRLAARIGTDEQTFSAQRIDGAHRLLFGRHASPEEIELANQYLSAESSDGPGDGKQYLSPWEEYLQALMLSNEFTFVD